MPAYEAVQSSPPETPPCCHSALPSLKTGAVFTCMLINLACPLNLESANRPLNTIMSDFLYQSFEEENTPFGVS